MDTNFGVVPYIFKDLCCGVIILCGICFMNLWKWWFQLFEKKKIWIRLWLRGRNEEEEEEEINEWDLNFKFLIFFPDFLNLFLNLFNLRNDYMIFLI